MAAGAFPAPRLRQAGVSAARIAAMQTTYNGWSAGQRQQFRAWIASNPDERIRSTYDPDGPGYTPPAGGAEVGIAGPSGDAATDTATVQAAIDAGPGTVTLRPGAYTVSGLTMRSGVQLRGAGAGATTLRLAAEATADVIRTAGFDVLTGTGNNTATGGPSRWLVADLTIDGNRAQQAPGAAGAGVRAYGYDYELSRVAVVNCAGDGIYSEWGGVGGPDVGGMEARFSGLRIADNGGWGWHHRGPNDSMVTDTDVHGNNLSGGGAGGVWVEDSPGGTPYLGGGLVASGVHVWGNSHRWGMVLDASAFCVNCESEGAATGQVLVRGSVAWHGGKIFLPPAYPTAPIGIQLGDDGATPDAPGGSRNYASGGNHIATRLEQFRSTNRASAALAWVNANSSLVHVLADLADLTVAGVQAAWGTVDEESDVAITATSSSSDPSRQQRTAASYGTRARGAARRDVGSASQALLIQSGWTDLLNLDTASARPTWAHLGAVDRWYADHAYSDPTAELDPVAGHLRWLSTAAPAVYAVGERLPGGSTAINGNDRRGTIDLYSGTGPTGFPGAAVGGAFHTAYPAPPVMTVTARDPATAALGPYVNAYSGAEFTIGFLNPPAAGTSYYLAYTVEG